MNKALALALPVLASVTACGGPSHTYRDRLTIEVDTPDGLKSGTGVHEMTLQDDTGVAYYPPESRLARRTVKGDAVFVDLGRGRHVIALLTIKPIGPGHAHVYSDISDLVPITFNLPSHRRSRRSA